MLRTTKYINTNFIRCLQQTKCVNSQQQVYNNHNTPKMQNTFPISTYSYDNNRDLYQRNMVVQYSIRQFGLFDKIFKKGEEKESIKQEEPEKGQVDEQKEELQQQVEEELETASQAQEEIEEHVDIASDINERDQNIEKLDDEEIINEEYKSNQQNYNLKELLPKSPKLIGKIKSTLDKLDDIQILSDGRVQHNVIRVGRTEIKMNMNIKNKNQREASYQAKKKKQKPGEFMRWASFDTFKRWRNKHLKQREEHLKARLSPLQFYVTQGIGHERPFTGDHWWTKDVGQYQCICCTQKLFMSDHKYESNSGYPTFWNHIIDAIEFKKDILKRPEYNNAFEDTLIKNKKPIQRVICSNCDSNLGTVFDDGPAPFYKRFMINSSSLRFNEKPWFTLPEFTREQKEEMKEKVSTSKKGREEFMKLIHDEKLMMIPRYKFRDAEQEQQNQMKQAQSQRDKERHLLNKQQVDDQAAQKQFDIKGQTVDSQDKKIEDKQ